jgi:hypothetical protein
MFKIHRKCIWFVDFAAATGHNEYTYWAYWVRGPRWGTSAHQASCNIPQHPTAAKSYVPDSSNTHPTYRQINIQFCAIQQFHFTWNDMFLCSCPSAIRVISSSPAYSATTSPSTEIPEKFRHDSGRDPTPEWL